MLGAQGGFGCTWMPRGPAYRGIKGARALTLHAKGVHKPLPLRKGPRAGCTEPGPWRWDPAQRRETAVRGREGQARGGGAGVELSPEEEGAVCQAPWGGAEGSLRAPDASEEGQGGGSARPTEGACAGEGEGSEGAERAGVGSLCGRGRRGQGQPRQKRQGGRGPRSAGEGLLSPLPSLLGPWAPGFSSGLAPWRTWTCPGFRSLRAPLTEAEGGPWGAACAAATEPGAQGSRAPHGAKGGGAVKVPEKHRPV